jgi:acetolactate decarboxylase
VPKQYKPYKSLIEVVKNEQKIFEKHEEMKGTLIGFYCPSFVKGVNVAGFHFHFLNKNFFFFFSKFGKYFLIHSYNQ